jgi:hypothetical protein
MEIYISREEENTPYPNLLRSSDMFWFVSRLNTDTYKI